MSTGGQGQGDKGGQWLNELLQHELARRSGEHQLRSRIPVTPIDATHVEIDGRRYVNFASNDYLGLSHHPAVVGAVVEATKRFGAGRVAVRPSESRAS